MSLKARAYLGVALYFLFKFAAIVFAVASGGDGPVATPVFYGIFLLGTAFLIWGCWAQARMKGYSGWLAIFGVFEFFGLIILALLPDRAKSVGPAAQARVG